MFKKFFAKKNDGFYLQIEDDTNSPQPAAQAKSPETASNPKPPTAVAASKAPVAAATTTEAAPAAKAAAPAPVVAPKPPAPPITNFATDYLIKPSSTSSRRRPGANMNGYLDMARQAKKPEFKKK